MLTNKQYKYTLGLIIRPFGSSSWCITCSDIALAGCSARCCGVGFCDRHQKDNPHDYYSKPELGVMKMNDQAPHSVQLHPTDHSHMSLILSQ
jgi:hypothetical protein